MPITHTKVSLVSDEADTGLVRPSDWNAEHTGSDEWDSIIVKPSDQSVTNSATATDDTALQIAVGSDEVWLFQLVIVYSGTSSAADYRWQLAVSAGTLTGWHRYTFSDTNADAILASSGVRIAAAANTAAIGAGTDAASTKRFGLIDAMYRFAQSVQTASNSVTTYAGSILRAKRVTA
jgi:hypothetical protein